MTSKKIQQMPFEPKMGPPPLISIIVPVYNTEKYLSSTIQSVLSQTFTNWELIIVDDGSKDNSYQTACQYAAAESQIHVFKQPNGGPAAARNTGYRHSNPASTYIAFLDGDDCWETDALENLVASLETSPNNCGAHGLARLIDEAGRLLPDDEKIVRCRERKRSGWETSPMIPEARLTSLEMLAVENMILTPGVVLIRRSAMEQAGLFDTGLFGTEDWEMWVRLSRISPFVFLEETVLNYRQHTQSVSRNQHRMSWNDRLARKKILGSAQNTPAQREAIRRGTLFFYTQIARSEFRCAANLMRKGHFVSGLCHLHRSLRFRCHLTTFAGGMSKSAPSSFFVQT